jgi:hypothetical protein
MPTHRPPCPELLVFLERYDPMVVELFLALRRLVLEEAPGASEIILDANYTVAISFTFTGQFAATFCHVTVYANHVNLGFNHGTELEDLEQRLEGEGKRIRHLRVNKLADLRQPHVRRYVRNAIEHIREFLSPVAKDRAEPTAVAKAAVKKKRPKPGT